MKRILLGTLAALASLTAVETAQAGRTFGLFVGCGRCCCNSCTFRVRQYNAFSPVCGGCITCDGMMPFGSAMPGLSYSGYGYGPGGPCGPGSSCDGPVSFNAGAPYNMMPTASYPQMASEMPTSQAPALLPQGQGAAQTNFLSNNVQRVGYYPNYGYGYAPSMSTYPTMNYSYPMMQVPSYWNPMGGR